MSAEFPSTLSVRLSRRWDVVTVVVVLAAAAIRLPRRWTVLGDNALMLMWTDAVGTRHTPMVGGDARFGFDHAGPWLFYVLAIPYRILGSSAVGLLVGASVINLVCLVVIIRCANGSLPFFITTCWFQLRISEHSSMPNMICSSSRGTRHR